jgi:molecular chaperone DnaK
VHVSAKDLGTGKEQKIRIESSSGLSDSEINRMVKDAELHADEDKKKRDLAEGRNKLDSLIYEAEKSLREYGDKLEASDKENLQKEIDAARSVLDSGDEAKITSATESLTQAAHKLAEIVYKEAAAKQQAGASGGSYEGGASGGAQDAGQSADSGNGMHHDNVMDADFEVVDDDKKS